jgi:hypothetical protein
VWILQSPNAEVKGDSEGIMPTEISGVPYRVRQIREKDAKKADTINLKVDRLSRIVDGLYSRVLWLTRGGDIERRRTETQGLTVSQNIDRLSELCITIEDLVSEL